jgi:hypothetical protein
MDSMETDHPPAEKTGRVVRLHFSCQAELPLGSFLRVTGSTLWAPGTTVNDPADAAVVVDRTEAQAFNAPDTSTEEMPVSSGVDGNQDLYTSSVEMVTTPADYPVWRTRRPVVVVLPQNRKHMTHHHYYRYLVVSPGGQATPALLEEEDDANLMEADLTNSSLPIVSTSNEGVGSTAVLQWEDPFGFTKDSAPKKGLSALSLASSVTGAPAGKGMNQSDLRNLPYRTIDIDFATAEPEATLKDRYGESEDTTLQHYLIREAVSLLLCCT